MGITSVLRPDYLFPDIYEITPAWLRKNGIAGVIFDLDGTLSPLRIRHVDPRVASWLSMLKTEGFSIMLLSNNRGADRVRIFCGPLDVPFISHAGKPSKKAFSAAARLLNLSCDKIAVVGDQIFTDILGGNLSQMTTILVHTLDRNIWYVRLRYELERRFMHPKNKEGCR